jgi:hypothetical protein
MKLWVGVLILVTACDDDGLRACNDMGCIGDAEVQLQLVDDSGAPVAARGEYRISSSRGGAPTAVPFDCTGAADAGTGPYNCSNAVLVLQGADHPSLNIEVRFELTQGGLSEWSSLRLVYTSQTDPNFNGPGCPCTWYDVADQTLLVPDGARRALPGVD